MSVEKMEHSELLRLVSKHNESVEVERQSYMERRIKWDNNLEAVREILHEMSDNDLLALEIKRDEINTKITRKYLIPSSEEFKSTTEDEKEKINSLKNKIKNLVNEEHKRVLEILN